MRGPVWGDGAVPSERWTSLAGGALMKKRLLTAGVTTSVALAVLGVLLLGHSGQTATAEDEDGVIVGIDMDPASNTATSLGTIDGCIEVSAGDVIDIDVFIDDIEAGPGSWSPDDECIAGFQYDLAGWPASGSDGTPPQITAEDYLLFLNAAPGSIVFDGLGEPVPDGDDPHTAIVADFGTDECVTHGHTEGVLGRYTLDTTGAAPGVYELYLCSWIALCPNPPIIARSAPPSSELIIQDVWDSTHSPQYGLLAVGVPCQGSGTPMPTATATPSPTPSPTTVLLALDTPNPQRDAEFGSSLAVGDVDGDGNADIAVGAPWENVEGNQGQGRAYVFSGHDGSLLLTLDTPNSQGVAGFGYSVALEDVNGDGNVDIAVGAPAENQGQGRAYVFSGDDGSLLLTLDTPNPQGRTDFGHVVALGDVDGDGKADIAVGAPVEDVDGNAGQGRAYVFSGHDGSLLLTLATPNPQCCTQFGYSMALEDMDSDGKADIAVGAPAEGVEGTLGQGRAYVFSGDDGSLLLTLDSPIPEMGAAFGYSVALEDVNGHCNAHIAVGAWGTERVYVFCGADGSLLFSLSSSVWWSFFGQSVAMGDVDGDGNADIAVGAPAENQGRAYVFSGDDGSLLLTPDTPNPQGRTDFGHVVALGDVDGDGKANIAVGAPVEDVQGNENQGRAYVFSYAPPPTPTPPPGVGGIVELQDGSSDLSAHQSDMAAHSYAALAAGLAAAVLALTAGAWYARRRWLR